ncbi:MAG: KamA family radical SAM protein [Sediminispirochaetaceae bacterium]
MCSKKNEASPGEPDWHLQRKRTVRSPGDLPESFTLRPEEKQFFDHSSSLKNERALDFAVTPYYMSLAGDAAGSGDHAAAGGASVDPVRLQCIPTIQEYNTLPYESRDPISDLKFSPVERLVHRYRDRALILVTDECAVYCRHCFRRHFASSRQGVLTPDQLRSCIAYLNSRPEIHEVILSGGDPLTLEDEKILRIVGEIRRGVDRLLVLRLATRTPVVLPQRITPGLAEALAEEGALYVITQFNHLKEITPTSAKAVATLNRAGIPVLNQAVLLRGVNDSVHSLAALFQALLEIRVKPYYLFQGDLAEGTSHFRVPLERGIELVRRLRRHISGLAMPVYAVDLPEGGGKIPITENYLDGLIDDGEGKKYRFTGPDGQPYYYPMEQ